MVSGRRYYSTRSSQSVKFYNNADTYKDTIIEDNKGKSGIYLWRNLINDKIYVGSSSDLGRRFQKYYSIHRLEKGVASQPEC